MTAAEILAFVRTHRHAVIASRSASGGPQAATVGIAVAADGSIVFDTLKSTRKYANLMADPRCALVIGGDEEVTVQLEGETFEPSDEAERHRYQEAYFQAFPDGRERLQWPGIAHLVVRPTWMRYSDFRTDPPIIVEIDGPSSSMLAP